MAIKHLKQSVAPKNSRVKSDNGFIKIKMETAWQNIDMKAAIAVT